MHKQTLKSLAPRDFFTATTTQTTITTITNMITMMITIIHHGPVGIMYATIIVGAATDIGADTRTFTTVHMATHLDYGLIFTFTPATDIIFFTILAGVT